MKHFCIGLLLVCGLLQQTQAQSKLFSNAATNTVNTPHVRAELMAYTPDGVQPGKPFMLGLQMQHQPGWHTYWKNPGDSGLPIQLSWTLDSGLVAGAIQWPTPKKIPVGNLMNYGYEGAVLLAVPVTVSTVIPETQTHVNVVLKAQWLVCKTECIPEEGEFALKVPVRGSTAISRSLFDNAQKTAPQLVQSTSSFAVQDKTLRLTMAGLPAKWAGKQLEALPETGEIIEAAGKVEQSWSKGEWTAVMLLSSQRNSSAAGSPAKMTWLVKIAGGQSNPAVLVASSLSGAWPAAPVAAPALPSAALEAALAKNKTVSATSSTAPAPSPEATWTSAAFWLAVLGALLGGMILNLMPCVLPVLAIKLLSFAPKKLVDARSSVATIRFEHTQMPVIHSDDTLSFRASSGLFAVGVVGSFLLLALTFLAFRAAGQSLGWGFQLQSPAMVMSLAVLFLLIGLNLFDAFDVSALIPTRFANFHSNNPSIEALSSGALAVLIATPCTAPFMGASLGLAVSLPALQALLIFLALGIGMALPFIAIAAFPQIGAWLLKVLPKPGGWMAVLRHFLAWPVFATVVWLLWVYAQQTSINSAFAAVFSLLMVVALMWSLRLRAGVLRTVIACIFGLCLLLSVVFLGRGDVAAAPSTAATSAGQNNPSSWTPWSAAAQAQALQSGRPVFVDFTAAWCITCQVNKSSTLGTDKIQTLFKAKNVLLLRADWTRPDAAIKAELAKLGRSGLPVYAFYLPGAKAPQLLPELLTTGVIEDALSVL
jgi:thiol:disulfide interchange protein/DsbC/DsbD-like thiol-disulfide interchange protein